LKENLVYSAETIPREKNISVHTTETIPGRKIVASKGLVWGNNMLKISSTNRDSNPHFTGDKGHLSRERTSAVSSMQHEAVRLGADAVVGVRFATTVIDPWTIEMVVFGTAVETRVLDGSE